MWAQDAKKDLKKAKSALNQFNLSQDAAKLVEAKESIDLAMKDAEMKTDPNAYILMGDIYNEWVTQWVVKRQTGLGDPDELKVEGNPALLASMAYKKALEMAEKKYQTKDALKGIRAVQGNLSNFGLFRYEDQAYMDAHQDFREVLELHKLLKDNGAESAMDAEDDYNNQVFITGLAALNANSNDIAEPYFKELYDKKYDKPAVYEAYYQIMSAKEAGPEAAYPILEAARAKYPEDVSLLFAEINHYLKIGKMEALISKLDEAIKAEPNNVTLYSTMGSVYDNLYQKATEAGEEAKAQEYFDNALSYFNKGLEVDPEYFDAIYSIGVLYYNKAALITKEMNALADDYSKEGLKKFEDLKSKVFDQFNLALPYFQRCEKLNPNDLNTLIALKEIYAKEDDLETSDIFKERLEKVQNGGKNETSYFQK